MDKGHRYTDKQIEALEKRLNRFYRGISTELMNELTEYLKAHESEINALWDRLDNGEKVDIDEFINRELADEINTLADECVNTDQKAMEFVGIAMAQIFVFNFNVQASTLNDKTGSFIPFIKKMARKKRLLQPPNPDKMKDRLWHRIKIRYVVMNGIRRGRSINDISEQLETVTRMDINAAIRAARTACTNAENQGKLDAMFELRDKYGFDVKKMWFATLDNRTRTSHREVHGEVRELEEAFSNGLQFPADPDGDPSEVWNCRCTLLDVIGEQEIPESPKGMSRSEWEQQKPKYKHYPKKKR